MFNTAKQEPGETADKNVNRLRKLIKNGKYADLTDPMVQWLRLPTANPEFLGKVWFFPLKNFEFF
jgi:hypothetical protein